MRNGPTKWNAGRCHYWQSVGLTARKGCAGRPTIADGHALSFPEIFRDRINQRIQK